MIVVDTNTVAYLVIKGSKTARAEAVRARDRDWHTPGLLRHEWLNVVAHYVRKGLLSRDEAVRTYRRGIALLTIDDSAPDPMRIMNLHVASGCSSYDCQFVAAAIARNVPLVTSDQEVLDAFPSTAVDIDSF